jgi:tetratricopeptide (TPR) repeat protein
VRRDSGLALLAIAMVLAFVLYAPTLGRGLVDYDDPWLYGSNWILRVPSWASVHTVLFDLSSPLRFTLTPEYLPVRDLSVMADFALWGSWWGGFHLTSLVVYEASIALWFGALVAFGVDRRVAGLAVLLWALHPSHAESVAWLAERKGVLGMMFAGASALGYAKFRAGGARRWLVLAIACGVLAVWSKATAAFAIGALVGLELVLPARRVSWRRSLGSLAAIGAAAMAAYVPVLVLAVRWSVVGGSAAALPASRAAMVVGAHGFYLRLGAMAMPNAVAYPIAIAGPSAFDLALGAVGLVALVAAFALRRTPPAVKAGAVLWAFGYLPVSDLVLPLQMIVVADRYMLLPTLGLALAAAAGIAAIGNPRARIALAAAIVLAAGLRTLDAQATWRSSRELWARAVASSPHDGDAWAHYVEALDESGHHDLARDAAESGLAQSHAPRLAMHEALLLDEDGRHADAMAAMRQAADAGDPRAMANLAKWLLDAGRTADALDYARRAADTMPTYANGQRMHGKVALAAGHPDEALAAFERAYELERSNVNAMNLGIALVALGRRDEARRYLEPLLLDPQFAPRARELLGAGSPQR